jgi:predicted RNA-binding Zn ribbon-like protein
MTGTETHAGNLKLVGGWLCLDFVNTVDWRTSNHPKEWLTSYSDLVSWSRHTSILDDNKSREFLQKAALHPTDAAAVLERAKTLREALFRIFSSVVDHSSPNVSDIDLLNEELARALSRMRLVPAVDGGSWVYIFEDVAFDLPLWFVVRSAADLLASDKLGRVSRCSAKECGWLFLDLSRNRSRRWCAMEDCGNRAKAKRHYQRKRIHANDYSSK